MVLIENKFKVGLPTIFNKVIAELITENVWLAFCHQDFVFHDDSLF